MPLTPAPRGYPIKLVRDNTAEIINSSGEPGDLWYGPCPAGEVEKWLRKKLVEEVAEFLVDPGNEELDDVYAAVVGLAHLQGRDSEDLYQALLNDARGGFGRGVMMYGRHDEFDAGPMPRAACQCFGIAPDLRGIPGAHHSKACLMWTTGVA